jgi:predicted AAA+ superfamily ATPase
MMQDNCSSSEIQNLLVYRNLLTNKLVGSMQLVLNTNGEERLLYEVYAGLIEEAEKHGLRGNLWQSYIVYLISRDENSFSTTVEKTRGQIGTGLRRAVIHDLMLLRQFLQFDSAVLRDSVLIREFNPTEAQEGQDGDELLELLTLQDTSEHSLERTVDKLIAYYLQHGCGKVAGYAAFRWDEVAGLVGIKDRDRINLDDLVGYEKQKQVLMKNTEAFLANKPANNVLLVGARGTGKSSSVKALVNYYGKEGLRLVEVQRHQFQSLHKIINELRGRSQRFIVFLDDLSFEESETEYKFLKSVIEGSLESRPDNVLLYATSNRRHLIRESWSDRADAEDVHSADSVHEKISLSDRFGITLTYQAPDQKDYLHIVETLARQHAITLPAAELKKQALRWELSHSGRSGRVAQQFVKHIIGSNLS